MVSTEMSKKKKNVQEHPGPNLTRIQPAPLSGQSCGLWSTEQSRAAEASWILSSTIDL